MSIGYKLTWNVPSEVLNQECLHEVLKKNTNGKPPGVPFVVRCDNT